MGVSGVAVGIVVGAIMLVVVDSVLANLTFSSSLMETIKPYIVPVAGIGLIVLAARMAGGKR